MERHLAAKELGKLARPGTFFDFTRYRPHMRTVGDRRIVTSPNTVVRYVPKHNGRDCIFLHIREPHAMGEDYVDGILALVQHFNVTEYCRVGGMYDSVPHTRPLTVTGLLSEEKRERAKGLISSRPNTYQGPTSIVAVLGQLLSETDIDASSLMVHMPQYVQLDEDHMGAFRLMQVLCALYDFPETLADPARGQSQYQEITKAVATNLEVNALIKKLEEYYDKTQGDSALEEHEPLAPEVEEFLRDVGRRLEDRED